MSAPEMPSPARNIALIGFMGAGKTTVGRRLAEDLGWRFIDFDEAIERDAGMAIPDIFRNRGEAAFRSMEAQLTARLSSVHHAVLAPGGGWVVDPGNVARLPAATCLVWLRISPEEAVRRIGAAGTERPLLSGVTDPVARARVLLQRRAPRYGIAHITVDVDGRTTADIVDEIRSQIGFEG